MKACTKCGETKPLSKFPTEKRAKDGRRSQCTKCRYEARKAVKTEADLAKQRDYQRMWWEKNKHLKKAQMRDNHLLTRYKMNQAQFDEMLAAQGGVCLLCGSDDPQGKNWQVDHDHSCCEGSRTCGKCIRGLLCAPCNTGLGSFKDDPDLLRKAIHYLEG